MKKRRLVCCSCCIITSIGKQIDDVFLCNKCYKDIKKSFPDRKKFKEQIKDLLTLI